LRAETISERRHVRRTVTWIRPQTQCVRRPPTQRNWFPGITVPLGRPH
jgi:hypothetical protein